MSVIMTEMTWPEYAEKIKNAVLIVPVGSIEQHGYHLPLGVDTYGAFDQAKQIAEKIDGIVAPPICYGYKSLQKSGGGQSFPGTTSLDGQTLILLTRDLIREFLRHGAKKIVFYDHHFENEMFLHEGIDLALREAGCPKDVKVMRIMPDPSLVSRKTYQKLVDNGLVSLDLEHAALLETSLTLYCRPELVHMERAQYVEGNPFPIETMYPEDCSLVHPSGVLANPTKATAELGKAWVDEIVDSIAELLTRTFSKQ